MQFTGRGILLDIEGTTSSIRFVYDEMFPFVRRELERYVREHWEAPELAMAVDQIARDLGHEQPGDWIAGERDDQQRQVCAEVVRLMDGDVKSTGLKQLQGLIWEQGFASGELRAQVYDDVVPALRRWREAGLDVRIYSSGSIQAQQLFFGHTTQGDLLGYLRGHYDTTTGAKREATSYLKIAVDVGLPPAEILFLSDIPAELDAAHSAGMQVALVIRPGNAPVESGHGYPEIRRFDEIKALATKA